MNKRFLVFFLLVSAVSAKAMEEGGVNEFKKVWYDEVVDQVRQRKCSLTFDHSSSEISISTGKDFFEFNKGSKAQLVVWLVDRNHSVYHYQPEGFYLFDQITKVLLNSNNISLRDEDKKLLISMAEASKNSAQLFEDEKTKQAVFNQNQASGSNDAFLSNMNRMRERFYE